MNSIGFWRHAGVGLLLSAVSAVLYHVLAPALGGGTMLRGLLAGLGGCSVILLLRSLRPRHGATVTLSGWAMLTVLLVSFNPALWLWLLSQAVTIWLVRCLYRYDRLLTVVADAALSSFAIALALAVADHTHSLFLSLWSWFLLQSLVVFIPSAPAAHAAHASRAGFNDAFEQAHRTAESALRRLAQRH
jgi:hypothetical protein